MVFIGYIRVAVAEWISVVDAAPRIPIGLHGLYNADPFDEKTDNAHQVSPHQREDPDMEASIKWGL
jgi:hypothetical protein